MAPWKEMTDSDKIEWLHQHVLDLESDASKRQAEISDLKREIAGTQGLLRVGGVRAPNFRR